MVPLQKSHLMQKYPLKNKSCLWGGQVQSDKPQWGFLTASDRLHDQKLFWADIAGTTAHIKMLGKSSIMSAEESNQCIALLCKLYKKATTEPIHIPETYEDIHSYLEFLLTNELGTAGERIHAGRSRNDQVLLAVRLFLRRELFKLSAPITRVFHLLSELAEQTMALPMPGYTHMQVAMPSSFGLWFSCFAESLADDVLALEYAYASINQNPLGTAAGYGSSFRVNRELTSGLLGFRELHINPIYAQMSRGRSEKSVAVAISSIAATLSKLANDICLYSGQDYGFIHLDEEVCTGSSIMPHKKNPDLAELIRGHCNVLQNLPNTITLLALNLPTGYHRDMQLIKASLFPALDNLLECLLMTELLLKHITVADKVSGHEKYKNIYTVEAVNMLVKEGMTFRKAYQTIAAKVKTESFMPPPHQTHSHTGSMGKPDLQGLKKKFFSRLEKIPFHEGEQAIERLMNNQT